MIFGLMMLQSIKRETCTLGQFPDFPSLLSHHKALPTALRCTYIYILIYLVFLCSLSSYFCFHQQSFPHITLWQLLNRALACCLHPTRRRSRSFSSHLSTHVTNEFSIRTNGIGISGVRSPGVLANDWISGGDWAWISFEVDNWIYSGANLVCIARSRCVTTGFWGGGLAAKFNSLPTALRRLHHQ